MLSATVVGRLTRDAEIRTAPSGTSIASFAVATDHGYGDRKVTTFVGVSVFGKEAEFAGKLLKGERVAVAGAGYLRKWDSNGKSGAEFAIDAHRVEKLWEGQRDEQQAPARGRDTGRQRDERGRDGVPDDEIPF